jgi:Fe2+ or Zn2+ uptake regulation protein
MSVRESGSLETYVDILKKHDMKITPQRLEILKYLDKNKIHPTANQIYSALKKKNPSLSKTTVYNSLDVLKKFHIIDELTISKSESRYDFEPEPHHHFLCRNCGEITDIMIECPYLEKILKGKNKVEEVHGYFKGICENCLKNEKMKTT